MEQHILDFLLSIGTACGAVMLLIGPRKFIALAIGIPVGLLFLLISSAGRWRCLTLAALILLALAACAARPDVQWPSGPWSSVDETAWQPTPEETKELLQVP